MTFRTSQLVVEGASELGNPAAITEVNGPINQQVTVPPTQATLFQGMMTLIDHLTESVAIVGYVDGTKDVSAGSQQSIGGQFASIVTKSGPSGNTLTNIGIQAEASGGDANYAYYSESGLMRQTGLASFGGGIQVANGNVDVNGPGEFRVSTDRVVIKADGTGDATFKGTFTTQSTNWFKYYALGCHFGPDKEVYIGNGPAINCQYNSDVDGEELNINFWGYQGGVTRFRDLRICDGKAARCVEVIGSSKKLKAYGAIEAMGTLGSSPTWTSGTGAPAGTPPIGSMYSRTDGGAMTSLYVYVGGVGWTGIA